jgi:hypothetical protein
LEEHVASIFMLVSCLAYSSTLKMEATCSSEMSADIQWTTWRYIPEDTNLLKKLEESKWEQQKRD